ncbi:MAG: phosphoglycerate kinase, partial [Chlamydiota bacterium]
MATLSLKELPLKEGTRVLMRVDFNVPLSKNGEITDDSRIALSLPSIEYILKKGCSLVLMSHLGRPDGQPDPQFSLKICAKRLSELLKKPVEMMPDCIGPIVKKRVSHLMPG